MLSLLLPYPPTIIGLIQPRTLTGGPVCDSPLPPTGFGACHFSWVAFVPWLCSPVPFGPTSLHRPDCTLSHPEGRPTGDPVDSDPQR